MGGRFRAWLQLVRPFTLIAPFIAIFFGVIIQLSVYGDMAAFLPNIPTIIFAALALSAAQAVGQILNQIEDVEIDRLNNKDYRPITSGLISVEQAEIATWTLAIFAILVGFSVNVQYGLFMITFLVFGIVYNLEPFRVKRRLWLNTLSLSASRGLLPLPAAWCILGNTTDIVPWLLGTVMAMWVLAWQNTKDFNDVVGDRECGIMTPVVYHRWRTLTIIIGLFSLLTFALLTGYISVGWLPGTMLAVLLLALPTCWMFFKMAKHSIGITALENNELWASFYLTLAGFYIVTAAAYLIEPYLTLFS
jgi:4-hydroxybenzoate polyprenyltransferase